MKSPLWFAVPAVFVVAAVFIARTSLLASAAFAGLFVVSAIYVSSVGYYAAKGDYMEQVSWLADKVTKLNPEQQGVMFGKYPELSAFFQPRGRKAVIMVGPVDYRFFYEFMENSNHFQTWAQREIEGTQYESRDSRRRKWTLLTGYLMECGCIATSPAGQNTYQWRNGEYENLRQSLVIPYAGTIGKSIEPLPPIPDDRVQVYQAEAQ